MVWGLDLWWCFPTIRRLKPWIARATDIVLPEASPDALLEPVDIPDDDSIIPPFALKEPRVRTREAGEDFCSDSLRTCIDLGKPFVRTLC